MASKLLTEETKHTGMWSRGHASRVKQGAQSMLTHEHVSSQATLILEYINTQVMLTRKGRTHSRHVGMWVREHAKHVGTCKHVSMQGTLAREHVSTQDMLAGQHVRTQDTLVHQHIFITQTRNLADSQKSGVFSSFLLVDLSHLCIWEIVRVLRWRIAVHHI